MRYITLLLLSLSFCLTSFAWSKEVTGGAYRFTIPDDVTFNHQDVSGSGLDFYTFQWGKETETDFSLSLFLLSSSPTDLGEEDIDSMVELMTNAIENSFKNQKNIVDIKQERKTVKLGLFEGTEIAFLIKGADGITIRQYTFILNDGAKFWNGNFTSTAASDIEVLYQILKQAKRAQ